MLDKLDSLLSKNMAGAKRSAIREILKLTQNPEIISFAGGLPAEKSFPVEDIKVCMNEVLDTAGTKALQYGTTEGCNELREQIVKHYKSQGVEIGINNIMISTSSQQGLDLTSKIFINPEDKIICGLPSYLGGLSAFRSYGGILVGIKFDKDGMCPIELEKTLKKMAAENDLPKFIYLIPDFQNPAGITYPETRRLELLKIAEKYNLLIIEDSPYRELRFDGKEQKMMYDLDKSNRVVVLGTFSKILAPGFRIGWIIAHENIIEKFVTAKQSTDLCAPAILQMTIAKYMEKGMLQKNLKNTINMYRIKRDLMLDCFRKYMPQGITWTEPEGGLFLFLNLPEGIDAEDLFKIAIKNNVAFVIGKVFHCDGSGINTMRLNFSFPTHEQIDIGVKRLAESIKTMLG
ncbi:MAG: PLP-dependent aminotransferase family protein [Bacteroidales bacterium]|nr:PLP-dependent aminotransferase family protein [Bacteroidales bacterium]MDD4217399.1 PLP-dependent aminotransferase family protein [Bacteroidales bacterium]